MSLWENIKQFFFGKPLKDQFEELLNKEEALVEEPVEEKPVAKKKTAAKQPAGKTTNKNTEAAAKPKNKKK
jgi:hypothetical protein